MITIHSTASMPITHLFSRLRVLLLVVCVPMFCIGIGCDKLLERFTSPRRRLEIREAEIEQQVSLCRELERMGADCQLRLRVDPDVRIVLGEQWKGGKDSVALLARMERVDELTLGGEAVADDAISVGASLPSLSVLRIRNARLTPENAAQLPRAVELHGLELQDVTLDKQAWRDIYRLNLLWLVADSCNVVLSDVPPGEGELTRLMSLTLAGAEVDDTTLRRAGQLRSLRLLTASRSNITDAGLSHLGTLTHLTHLDLASARVKDLSQLPSMSLQKLLELVLDDTLVADDSLASLAGLISLESLSLNHTEVTDRGIEHLLTLQNLRTVSLEGTAVTDASLEKLSQIETLLTAIDAHGDVIVFQQRWLWRVQRWAAAHSKSIYLWTDQGRELVEAVATKSLSGE